MPLWAAIVMIRRGKVGRASAVMTIALSLLCLSACGRDPRHRLYATDPGAYRLLREGDFCSELPLFTKPDRRSMIGTVLDGAKRYIDPKSGREFPAVAVFTTVGGRRVDRWFRRDKLVGHVYVLKNDPSLGRCGYWMDREEPTRPLATEVPAD
jgi:hypothetical protein